MQNIKALVPNYELLTLDKSLYTQMPDKCSQGPDWKLFTLTLRFSPKLCNCLKVQIGIKR